MIKEELQTVDCEQRQTDRFKENYNTDCWHFRDEAGINQAVTRDVGATICEAFGAYSDGEFARAVDLLNPARYKVLRIGGSNAQVRDLGKDLLENCGLVGVNNLIADMRSLIRLGALQS